MADTNFSFLTMMTYKVSLKVVAKCKTQRGKPMRARSIIIIAWKFCNNALCYFHSYCDKHDKYVHGYT